jgi:hypothetical protein
VADGTPRDCSSNGCGSQADTAIIRTREISSGEASPLGRTQGAGPVDAAAMISTFMGAGSGNSSAGARPASQASIDADLARDPDKRRKRQNGAVETMVAQMAGNGATEGLPTADDNGVVTMTFYSVSCQSPGVSNSRQC